MELILLAIASLSLFILSAFLLGCLADMSGEIENYKYLMERGWTRQRHHSVDGAFYVFISKHGAEYNALEQAVSMQREWDKRTEQDLPPYSNYQIGGWQQ